MLRTRITVLYLKDSSRVGCRCVYALVAGAPPPEVRKVICMFACNVRRWGEKIEARWNKRLVSMAEAGISDVLHRLPNQWAPSGGLQAPDLRIELNRRT